MQSISMENFYMDLISYSDYLKKTYLTGDDQMENSSDYLSCLYFYSSIGEGCDSIFINDWIYFCCNHHLLQ